MLKKKDIGRWEHPDGTFMTEFKGKVKVEDRQAYLTIGTGSKKMGLEELNKIIQSFEGWKIEIKFIDE